MQALVKPDGTVKKVKILGGHPMLAAAVASAVMQWKFQPAPRETAGSSKVHLRPAMTAGRKRNLSFLQRSLRLACIGVARIEA